MALPTTFIEISFLIAALLPGLVFASVRVWLRGHAIDDIAPATRVLQAAVVGIAADLLYLLTLGPWILRAVTDRAAWHQDVRTAAAMILILGIAIPFAVSYAIFGRPFHRWKVRGRAIWVPLHGSPHRSTPTAWDRQLPKAGGTWVRIRLPDGTLVGGWLGNDSYLSTYPMSRDIYLESQHAMKRNGEFGEELPGTAGVWLSVPDGSLVTFTRSE